MVASSTDTPAVTGEGLVGPSTDTPAVTGEGLLAPSKHTLWLEER